MELNAIQKIERYLHQTFNFRYNEITGKVEFKRKSESKFDILTDYTHNSILRELANNDINCVTTTLKNILFSNFVHKYDPFRQYFHRLPKWDKREDYIGQLAKTVSTTNDCYWHYAFKKWIVAVVACAINDKVVNHSALIFTGGQGVGKTTWLENLIPKPLKEYQFSGTINLANKDTTIHLAETMLINMDELENMNAHDIGKLKQVITQSVIRLRRPYAVYSENYIRRASFTGSINSSQFLNDTTGSRRFLCFEIKEIQYINNVNLDMVYSQALALYRAGFKFYFDKKSINLVNNQNDTFEIASPEEEYLLTYFEPAQEDQATAFLNATMLLSHIEKKARTTFRKNANVSFGKILHKHNFIKTKRNGLYVYAVKERFLERQSLN